jgi:hypothetical protein
MRMVVRFLVVVGLMAGLAGAGVALAQDGDRDGAATEPGWHGLAAATVTADMAREMLLGVPFGAIVRAVEPGSPAAVAGLAVDDVILALDGAPIADATTLAAQLGRRAAGTTVALARLRAGQMASVNFKLGARPRPAEPPVVAGAAPRLMLDTGGHMGLIKGLAFTPDGRQIVTAGEDKVIRVWDPGSVSGAGVASGRTVRTIRGEAEAGDAGKVYALALSPDGRWLAVGGWMKMAANVPGHHIRLHDFASGRLVALLPGHGNVVNGLAFSPDGRWLVSGSGDYDAILWDMAAVAAGGPAGGPASGAAAGVRRPVLRRPVLR